MTLALYAWPKPYTNPHIAMIQRNAIRSWLELRPTPEVYIFGEEAGIAGACADLGVHHVRVPMDLVDSVPPVRSLAQAVESKSNAANFCFINADIILTRSIMDAIRNVSAAAHGRFLLGGSPWNTDVLAPIEFSGEWEAVLRAKALAANQLRSRACADFLVHPRGLLRNAPSVLAGRAYVDSGLMWWARKNGIPLVDGTSGVFAVHQNHNYDHLGINAESQGASPGAIWNLKQIGGMSHIFTWSNATDHYTRGKLQPYWPGRVAFWSTHLRDAPSGAKAMQAVVRTVARCSSGLRGMLGLVNPRVR